MVGPVEALLSRYSRRGGRARTRRGRRYGRPTGERDQRQNKKTF